MMRLLLTEYICPFFLFFFFLHVLISSSSSHFLLSYLGDRGCAGTSGREEEEQVCDPLRSNEIASRMDRQQMRCWCGCCLLW